jgi:hypothetical protein
MNSQSQFDVNALKSGDLSQLDLFRWTTGQRSIYIEWVPDQMNEDSVKAYFAPMGKIVGVDFVNHKVGRARMLFVHFEHFYNYDDPNVVGIVEAYPQAYEVPISFPVYHRYSMTTKNYTLRCRINLTPTPRVEYNLAQLTEMVDRLRKDVEFFKDEVAQLKKKVNVEKLDDDSEIFEEPIFQKPSTGEVDGGFYSGKRDDFYTHQALSTQNR